ncbi:hypothetical protein ACVWY3_002425 [Bradyrhizobium sp. USDA 4486]
MPDAPHTSASACGRSGSAWHGGYFIIAMIQIPAVDQAFLLLLIVSCLGTCLVRAFWELEQVRTRRIASPSRGRDEA